MKQIAAITAFLLDLDLVAAEQIESWVENPQIVPAGTWRTAKGVVIYRQRYTAVIAIERYPHKRHPAELLFAHISAWLIEHDGERFDNEDAKITTDVEILDDDTADILVSIDFVEEVEIVEDEDGPIALAGKTWTLAGIEIDYALAGEVTT
jgi:hypothetical protein